METTYAQCEHTTPGNRCEAEVWNGGRYCVPHTLCRCVACGEIYPCKASRDWSLSMLARACHKCATMEGSVAP